MRRPSLVPVTPGPLRALAPMLLGAALIAPSAGAQDAPVENYRPGRDGAAPNWIYPYFFNVRLLEGGRNSAREAQLYTCTERELERRSGACASLPAERDVEFGTPVRVVDAAGKETHGLVWLGDHGWKRLPYALAKTTQGLARARWVKQSPGQGSMISLQGVNAAQGDMMGVNIELRDPIGAHAGGDEGLMPLVVYLRDYDMVATGATLDKLRPGADGFRARTTSARTHHLDQVGPRRLLVWTDGPRIPFRVTREGHNPKPMPPTGGATWKLDTPLEFPDGQLPATQRDVFAHDRTDWCATLDDTAYTLEGSRHFNYVLVARFDSDRAFTTHRLAQGQDVGLYQNEYVKGYRAVDHAADAGHVDGHLRRCSIVTGAVGYGRRADKPIDIAIAPIVDSVIPAGSAYTIPSMGTMGPEAIKVLYDFKLGSGGARTGVQVATLSGPDHRMGDRAFVASGHWREAFTAFDAEAMLQDFHPRYPKDAYVLAELRGSSSWNGHEIQLWYPEPKNRGRARVEIPHVAGDSALVLVQRGRGAPEGRCSEPGLQRYYDLAADRDYVCASNGRWKGQ